jgi:hypothetical protein
LGIDRDKVPSNAQSLTAPDITTQGPTSFTTQLNQRIGSVNIEENQGNPFQPDVLYRGFEGSPILGTPIGIAVYQNGVRLNEPFGDNINWDLIPNFAINSSSIIPTNPVYGLNALGGAFVIEMKNGFNFHGFQGDFAGGSFGQNQSTLQYGQQVGNVGAYIGGNLFNDGGFRKLSPSHVRQLYADIGAESEHGSLHLSFTGANNTLAGIGPTPIQLADIDRCGCYGAFDHCAIYASTQDLGLSACGSRRHAVPAIGKRGGSFRAGAGLRAPGLRDGELHASRKPLTDRGCGECWYYPFRYGGYLRTGGERAAVGRGVEIH